MDIWQAKLKRLKWILRTRVLQKSVEAKVDLRTVRSLEQIQKRMRRIICLNVPSVLWICGRNTCQFLKVPGVNDVRRTEIHTTELLVPAHSAFEFEMATEIWKIYHLTGTNQTPEWLIQAQTGPRILHTERKSVLSFNCNRKKFRSNGKVDNLWRIRNWLLVVTRVEVHYCHPPNIRL
jgi:hypothetical protein